MGEEIVNVILSQDSDHGVRGSSAVVSGKTDPQTQKTLVLNAFSKAVNNIFVWKFSNSI